MSAEATFRAVAGEMGIDPDDRWVGGYVSYEWDHLRPVLSAYGIAPAGREVLEFGCNYGASGIVMGRMGARVTGVDVNAGNVRLANANIAMHAVEDRAEALYVPDTRNMPFGDGAFDLVVANSVLEYVAPDDLDAVLAEIHRVIGPGGHLLVLGTASRLAPREVHSRRWLVNYLPAAVDRMVGKSWQRGLSPFALARALRGRFAVVKPESWLAARRAVHGRASLPMRLVAGAGRISATAPGWLSPNIELLLLRR